MYIKQEYPKYIPLPEGYVIVESKEEELKYLKEEENESTNKNDSKRIDKKKSNANRNIGDRRESN